MPPDTLDEFDCLDEGIDDEFDELGGIVRGKDGREYVSAEGGFWVQRCKGAE